MTIKLIHDTEERRYFWIDRDEVEKIWPEASVLLHEALDYGDGKYHIDDLRKMVEHGKGVLWVGMQGVSLILAGVSWVVQYPQSKRFILGFCAANNIKHCYELLPLVEAYAKDCGCSAMEVWGRRGWLGRLDGFEEIHTVSRMRLWPAAETSNNRAM